MVVEALEWDIIIWCTHFETELSSLHHHSKSIILDLNYCSYDIITFSKILTLLGLKEDEEVERPKGHRKFAIGNKNKSMEHYPIQSWIQ